ncbi:MAG: hypothetical protein GY757_58930 [bacterium]|nr:hypothetical protein [bacterium]
MHKEDFFHVVYSLTSTLAETEPEDYTTEYNGDIVASREEETAGKVIFSILHIAKAIERQYPIMDVFDVSRDIFSAGEVIWDSEENQFNEDIERKYDTGLHGTDICYLNGVAILPQFRGQKLAGKVIKDIIDKFCRSCALVVLKACPLQFDPQLNWLGSGMNWRQTLGLQNLVKDEEIAKKNLKKYYSSWGFERYRQTEYMLLCPAFKNLISDIEL